MNDMAGNQQGEADLPEGSFRGSDGLPYLGLRYDTVPFSKFLGLDPLFWEERGATKEDLAPSVENLVRATQKALSVGVDPAKIGDWEEALDEEQLGAYLDDKHYRADLVRSSGGEVSVFEGIVISEEEDPYVQRWIAEFEVRERSAQALAAMEAYEASTAIRLGFQAYRLRLRLQARVGAFWEWLTRVES